MDKAEMLELYRQMVLIRLFEEKCEELYQKGKIGGFMHLYIGQEATGVGAVAARQPQDSLITGYRDHGIALAAGMSARTAMAEMLGRVTGCAKGKGGSMHLADINLKFWGGHAIVGAQIALAAGLAWADQFRQTAGCTLCFFGDGATNISYFHEALNLAAVWKLPVVFICENNKYGMWTPVEKVSAVTEIRRKASAYAIPSDSADGMDLLDVRAKTAAALAHCRAGNGPYFLEVHTYRYRGARTARRKRSASGRPRTRSASSRRCCWIPASPRPRSTASTTKSRRSWPTPCSSPRPRPSRTTVKSGPTSTWRIEWQS
mgnify:CR=1 FL=1